MFMNKTTKVRKFTRQGKVWKFMSIVISGKANSVLFHPCLYVEI